MRSFTLHGFWLLTCLSVATAAAAETNTPNLLIIHTDEHHFNTLGCYGGTIVKTTHIDSLAKEGARCTSYYATTPVCSPSRSALLSGLYPQHTPVVSNNIPLDDNVRTFAQILQARGYETGYAGKWHLDGNGKPQWAPQRKFGFADNRFMFNRGHWKSLAVTSSGPKVAARNQNGAPSYALDGADERSFTTDWLTDRALDFIEQHKDRPFCFMLSIPDPHGPNTVRPPYDTMYADVEVPIPPTLRKPAEEIPAWGAPSKGVNANQLRKIMPNYYGMVKCIDDNTGRLLARLREHDILDSTVIVLTSDHGDLCGEHGRLNKGVPYEGSARIPFLIRYPQRIPAGTVVDEALTCVDFMPTVLKLMEVELSTPVHGRDASPLFTGKGKETWKDIAFMRSTGQTGWLCAVSDRYKLVFSQQDRPWLFDLVEDPEERKNRFDDVGYAEIRRQLTRDLMAYCREYYDPNVRQPEIRAAMDKVLAE